MKNIFLYVLSICFLSACQFNANLINLGEKTNGNSSSTQVLIYPQNQSIVAGQSLTFSSEGGSNKYSYSILQGSGSINGSTGEFIAGTIEETVIIQVMDTDGKTSQTTVEVKPPMSLTVSNLEIYSGSNFTYTLPTPAGGIPSYTYSLFSGLGSILGNQYTPPNSAGTAVVKVADSANGVASLNLKIRHFENKVTQDSGSSALGPSFITGGVEIGSELLVMAYHIPVSSTFWLENLKPPGLAFYKTSDNGATWTYVSNFRMREDSPIWGTKLLKSGSKLYLVGHSKRYFLSPIGNNRMEPFVAESADNGVSWTVKSTMEIPADADSVYFNNAETTNDNSIVILGQSNKVSSDLRVSFIRKCNLSNWSCSNVYEHMTSSNSHKNDLVLITKDTSGNLYVTHHRYSTTNFTNDIYLKKSTTNGNSWVESLVFNGDDPEAMDVSGDGQTIVISGSTWVNPAVSHHSYDGGTTWTRIVGTSDVCPGWNLNQVVIKDNTREILGGCYNYSAGVYTFYVVRLPYLGTSWNNRLTISGTSGGTFVTKSDGTVLISISTIGNTRVTSDFGNTFSTTTQPSQTQVTDFEFQSVIQTNPTTLYAAGYAGTATAEQKKGVVYVSTDSGATWTLDHIFSDLNSYIGGLAVSPTTGTIIGVSRVETSKWRTMRKPSAGAWAIAETYVFAGSPFYSNPAKAYSDTNGRFITLGSYYSGGYYWYVRSSTDDGVTWSTLDNYQYVSASPSYATDATFDGTDIWVAGYAKDASSVSHWLVKKYNGSSWSVEDDFVIPSTEGVETKANGIFRASDGSIYVVGEYTKLNAYRTWVVRKKLAGSSVWQTIDTYQESATKHAAAMNITQTTDGRLFVSGISEQSNGSLKSATRVLYPEGWKTVDIWGIYGISTPKSVIPCLNNQICIASSTVNSGWQYRGIIRILSP